jgi:cytochrome c oxidase subunit 3
MWVFLSSETLLFAALFGLYAGYREHYPAVFHEGIREMAQALGAVNTFVLLTSSLSAALSLAMLRLGRARAAAGLCWLTVLFGLIFLSIKAVEYSEHIRHGLYPRATGALPESATAGLGIFASLYFAMTGLHALHVLAGICVLGFLGRWVYRRRLTANRSYPLELGVLYWHLVDAVWVFLWPLFYLTGGKQ